MRTPMHKLRDDITEVILNVHDFAPEVTRSDLQGIANAEALNIITLVLNYIKESNGIPTQSETK